MEAPGYPAYDVASYLSALNNEGERLADAAQLAGLRAGVPACPAWSVSDLLRHTSYVHRWAADIVAERITHPVDELAEEQVLQQGPDDERLLGWFREGHEALVRTLAEADPDLNCWSFLSAPSPLAFWARRQAHETAIHRVDAEQAAAAAAKGRLPVRARVRGGRRRRASHGLPRPQHPPRRLARPGRQPGDPGGGRAGRAAGWLVTGRLGGAAVARGTGPADCTVTGPARDLYLLLWNRGRADGLRVTGDASVLAAFRGAVYVTWN